MKVSEEQDNEGQYLSRVEPIAIIGMSCRFPKAPTLNVFWELLNSNQDTISDIPRDRWNFADYYDADPKAVRKTNQRHASMLERIHDFDPLFFSISPAEAGEMNPSQKLMLELVWEAIENSNTPLKKIQGKKVGVYVGNIWSDFEHLRKHKNAPVTSHSAMGQSSNIIANRVSFTFGFTGPSLVVDTGCSSSLVALHLACQSLWDNSTEMSFASGINHILDPDQYILLSKFGGLSSTGKCSTFDREADGFVRGEGAGVIMLKKLSHAERDGDNILALIRGTAINNNGFNASLPATSVAGQKQVLADAYKNSGIAPHEIHYVEAHGTGTKLGDPTEARALGEFFSNGRGEKNKLHIGSVKTNIGHLEGAAGIAGLIKVVLAIGNKQLPSSLNYKNPNPTIPFDELKLSVQHEAGPWPAQNGESLKAGINSFGWGGTNAHTVIEEYIPRTTYDKISLPHKGRCCLPISTKSFPALKDYVNAYLCAFQLCSEDDFAKICVASAIVKPSFDHRILFSANERDEMIKSLQAFIADPQEIISHQKRADEDKIVMVFPGQGSQWLGMGQQLFRQEPIFREAINECNEAFKPYTDWSLTDQLYAPPDDSLLQEINVIQPMLFAVQVALARLWISWGIHPHAVVGHSMGEVAAAYISGAISLNDAARIICLRSKLMKTVSGKGGAMAMTALSLIDAEALIKNYPQLSIAVNNSPGSTVLAGDEHIIQHVLTELERQNIFCRLVKVDVASHSRQMDPLKEDLRDALQTISVTANSIPFYSTVRAKAISGEELNADYWVDNLRNTVQFNAVIDQLMKKSHTIFIEVSPHPVLINALNECAQYVKAQILALASLYREKPEQDSIYKNLSELYSNGYEIDWEIFYQTQKAPHTILPSYPFQRARYELEDKSSEIAHKKTSGLLGDAIHLADSDAFCFWETTISLSAFPYLQDHLVNGTCVLPGAAYVEMVFEAADELSSNKGTPVISQLQFIKSITLSDEESATVQLKFLHQPKGFDFRFFMKSVQPTGKPTWDLLAKGELRIKPVHHDEVLQVHTDASFVETSGASFYESLKSLGLQYGPYFQNIISLSASTHYPDKIYFDLIADKRIQLSAVTYKIPPALLDSFFQPLFGKTIDSKSKQNPSTSFLTEIGEVYQTGSIDPSQKLHGIASLKPLKKDQHRGLILAEADISIYNAEGVRVLSIKGIKGKTIDTEFIEQRKEKLKNWLYSVHWVRSEKVIEQFKTHHSTWVVMGDPYGVSGILTEKMEKKNISCIHVTPGTSFCKIGNDRYIIRYGSKDDYGKLIQDLFVNDKRKITGILHAGSMSYTWQDPFMTADRVEEQQVYGSISFMYLHQQLEQLNLNELPKLVIVTNGIQAVGQEHNLAQPVHSPLWGMVKVMFNELTQYHCRYIDLSANPSMEELDQVVTELKSTLGKENEIALRGSDQYVPRLGVPVPDDTLPNKRKQFSASGTYLITGFRGLGFVFIEWMIRQGARNFALVSRTGEATPNVLERISILESQGCRFRIFTADAGNYQDLKNVLEEIELSMTPLSGVVHAAGVIEARKLTDLDPGEFLRILNPKVKGAWNLHLLTQMKPLDCFIMFSSASTLIGLSGQGSYVAANAFLDTLAHSRKKMGLPGISVNWGVIKDVGMVANHAELERYARAEGFEPVTMNDAMEVFNLIYDSDYTQIGIAKLNAESVANYYSALGQTSYFKGLLQKEKIITTKQSHFQDRFKSITTFEERITALEQLVIEHIAVVVKTSPAQIKPAMTFQGLGIDSLMAIQLWNMLERSLNTKLSLAMFWANPIIREYIARLYSILEEQLLPEKNIIHAKSIPASNPNWFVIPNPNRHAKCRIFCFHDAGGNALLYHGWETHMRDDFELVPVELPGRCNRLSEKPYTNLSALINDLLPAMIPLLDKPFYFFGHSMGGLLAFELVRALRKKGQAMPDKIFISSTPALTTYSRREVDHTISDEELVTLFPHLSSIDVNEDSLHAMLLNLLRADLQLLNNYRYAEEEPLDIPLTVIHGIDDDRVKKVQAEQWQRETISSCEVISRPGGHRYIEDDAEFLTALIQENIRLEKTRHSYEGVY